MVKAAQVNKVLYEEISEFYTTEGKMIHYLAWTMAGLANHSDGCAASLYYAYSRVAPNWKITPKAYLSYEKDKNLYQELQSASDSHGPIRNADTLAQRVCVVTDLARLIEQELKKSPDLAVIKQLLVPVLMVNESATFNSTTIRLLLQFMVEIST